MKAEHTNLINKDRVNLHEVIPLNAPLALFIDICNLCNFRCSFCAMHSSGYKLEFKKQLMERKVFESIIDNLHNNNIKLKALRLYTNGEPFLHPDIIKFIQYAKKMNICDLIEITTNGSKLNPKLNEKLVNNGIDRIRISIEAIDEKGYQEIAGVSIDFEKFRDNILDLYQRSRGKCEIYIKIVDAAVETGEKKELFYKLFEDRCDKIFIENIVPIWTGWHEINDRFDIGQKGSQGQEKNKCTICTLPFYSCVINPDGTVVPCCADWERKLILGNVMDSPFIEIWNSKMMKEFWISLLEGKKQHIEPCNKCEYIKYCSVDNIDLYAKQILERIQSN